ncbi:Glutamate-gated chloride channel [Folsomia candida]|uniref:Glutamate-gated chloride channel n=1 Tax=Folsomia candida TaxID=158441 RepID=A0A226EI05_FOLCA|nr:Glutamate-gated chloride channel [Folsomia candida]
MSITSKLFAESLLPRRPSSSSSCKCAVLIGIIFITVLLLMPAPAQAQRRRFLMRQREKQILDIVLSNTTYDNRIRPSPLLNSTTGETQVYVNLLIRSVSKIDDFAMEYSVQLLLREEWYDDRLKFESFRSSQASTSDFPPYLTIVDTKRVWMPDIFFINEKEGRLHGIIKPNEYVRIYPDGNVLFSVRISLVLACPMDLQFFPMDEQTCRIAMASYGLTTEDIVFHWKVEEPVQVPNLTLPRFNLQAVKTYKDDRTTNTGTYSTLKADFVLRRNFSYYMTQLYIPCIMLVIVSQVSFYIAVPARTALGITTLLTMATQSASINRSLPPVSYTKSGKHDKTHAEMIHARMTHVLDPTSR